MITPWLHGQGKWRDWREPPAGHPNQYRGSHTRRGSVPGLRAKIRLVLAPDPDEDRHRRQLGGNAERDGRRK
jgi:hypothetical protein